MDKSKTPTMTKRSTPLDMIRRVVDNTFDVSGGAIKRAKKRRPSSARAGDAGSGASGYMKRKKDVYKSLDDAGK